MEHNTTVRKRTSSSETNEKNKINFIDKKINRLRRKKSSKIAMLIVDFYDFYKKEILRKHLLLYVISLVLFFVMLVYFSKSNNIANEVSEIIKNSSNFNLIGKVANFKNIFTDKLLVNLILLISGITPYIYIPILGVMYSYTLVLNIIFAFNNIASNMNTTFMTIGSIVQMFGISFTSAMGIYLCKIATKKFRYNQKVNFTFNDVKKEYYTIKKDEKKLREVLEKEDKRIEKIEKLNVKIPYKNLIISFVISSLIIIIGGFITLI